MSVLNPEKILKHSDEIQTPKVASIGCPFSNVIMIIIVNNNNNGNLLCGDIRSISAIDLNNSFLKPR